MWTKKCIGVVTCGGDSQGMNAAIRAVVRMTLFKGHRAFLIYDGYKGMIAGGESIKEATWISVTGLINKGGTIIRTARCQEFRERSGRMKAALNLVQHGINNLVII